MPQQISIPRLGWSMEEGVFCEWLKSPGEYVKAGDMLYVLEGEKASQEIESFDSGILCVPGDAPMPGSIVKVGQVIGFLLAEGEPPVTKLHSHHLDIMATSPISNPTVIDESSYSASDSHATRVMAPHVAGPAARRLARELGIDLSDVHTSDPTGRVRSAHVHQSATKFATQQPNRNLQEKPVATPRARRRARELGMDWTVLTGTGRDGRIRERDLIVARPKLPTTMAMAEPTPTVPGQFHPASKLRRIIAQRMSTAIHQAAPVTLTTKVNAESLVAQRNRLKDEAVNDTIVPTYNDMLIAMVAQTLHELRELNACWHREGIYTYDEIHIATAIDTPAGLLAPVVRNANTLLLSEIARETKRLIQLARNGQLQQEQLTGGTFSVTNLGMLGIDVFTPILNLPQAAILGIGRIVEEPVVRSGRLDIGQTLTLSLTFDHRVVDGAPASRWLQRLCDRIVGRP